MKRPSVRDLVFCLAFVLGAAVAAHAQTAYKVYTDLVWDEGFGLRSVNGTDSGTGTGAAGTFTDGTKSWTVDQWAGGWLTVNSTYYPIASNTATVLTITGTPPSGPIAYTLKGGWRGWNILGATDVPYDFVDEYPEDGTDIEVKRLQIDIQDRAVLYPRSYAVKDDTGRVLRMQILDGGNALDLTGATILFYSWTQDDDTRVRDAYDITTYVSSATDGYIELVLDSTYETAESVYFYINIDDGSYSYDAPPEGYIYIDVEDKAATDYTIGEVRPTIKIKVGGWDGKSVRFQFYDVDKNTIDLSGATVEMNYAKSKAAGAFLAPTAHCTTAGVCTYDLSTGKFADADSLYTIYFKLTDVSGKVIYVPSRGDIILETQ